MMTSITMEDLLKQILTEVRNLSYLFFAFGAIWVLIFAYLVSLARRASGLRDEIAELKRERAEDKK